MQIWDCDFSGMDGGRYVFYEPPSGPNGEQYF